ncbi:exopolysaccharide biosynthesis polyprenyl glycosylphosphotransferase [Nocardioides maradonensis]
MADTAGVLVIAGCLLPPVAAAVMAAAWWFLLALTGSQVRKLFARGTVELGVVCQVALGMVVVSEIVGAALWPGHRGRMVTTVGLTLAWLVACRAAAWGSGRVATGAHAVRRVVAVGARPAIERWMDELAGDANPEFVVVAACVVGRRPVDRDVPTVFEVGHVAVTRTVAAYAADAVLVVPCSQVSPAEIRRIAWSLESSNTEMLVAPGLPELVPQRALLGVTGSVSVLHVRRAELRGMRRTVKNVVERSVAAVALLVLAPLLLLLLVIIRGDSPGPALYCQRRIGRGGRPFTMLKLRTMVVDADRRVVELSASNDADGVLFKLRADPRVTRVGRVLRRYSLDELPQLWNVVRGDMALVGPRPALPDEVARYSFDMRRRMVVKPGLTGLWQVSGRSDLSWTRAMQLDLYYVDNWSLGLDVAIVFRTVHAVLAHGGAY